MTGKNATQVLPADAAGIVRAAQILRDGGLVAVPTETVYGLAARADDADAVARIYEAKGRPSFNPLIVHVANVEQARRIARWSTDADIVADVAWPGPLTLVLPLAARAALAPAVTAGLDTVAIRMPAHPVMQAVIAAAGVPLAAPSANRSGFVSPTSATHAATLDGRIDLVLDAGECENGIESTILAIRQDGTWEELRPGPVDVDAIFDHYFEDVARERPRAAAGRIEAPGQLASHYSPGKPVRLNASVPDDGEYFIGFGPIAGDFSLSETGDLRVAAQRLYQALHRASAAPEPRIAVAEIPDRGLGRAINDRLRRAAA